MKRKRDPIDYGRYIVKRTRVDREPTSGDDLDEPRTSAPAEVSGSGDEPQTSAPAEVSGLGDEQQQKKCLGGYRGMTQKQKTAPVKRR